MRAEDQLPELVGVYVLIQIGALPVNVPVDRPVRAFHMKVSELEFLRLLPAFMRDDEAAIALSKAMNRLIGEPSKRLKTLRVWDNIDNLNEAECDELAWELDVDWYDSTGMSLEEKRATLKIAQQVKRKRGTKWAVEQLISAYFGEGYIMEWYEMYGTPYTFVALTTNPHITAQNFGKFVEAVKAAKNVRSHLAGVFYFWQQGPDPGIEYALGSKLHRYNFVKCGTRPRIATVGFIVKQSIETEPEEKLHLYGFPRSGTIICGTYPRPGTLGAAAKNEIAVEGTAEPIRYGFGRTRGRFHLSCYTCAHGQNARIGAAGEGSGSFVPVAGELRLQFCAAERWQPTSSASLRR